MSSCKICVFIKCTCSRDCVKQLLPKPAQYSYSVTLCAACSQSQPPAVSQPGGGGAVTDITEEAQATVHQESSEAVSALLASQNAESTALSPYLPLNPYPVSSPPVPPSPSLSEGGRKAETEPSAQQQHGLTGGGTTAARSSGNKMEFAPSEVIR